MFFLLRIPPYCSAQLFPEEKFSMFWRESFGGKVLAGKSDILRRLNFGPILPGEYACVYRVAEMPKEFSQKYRNLKFR